jgi:hypothetical protein
MQIGEGGLRGGEGGVTGLEGWPGLMDLIRQKVFTHNY